MRPRFVVMGAVLDAYLSASFAKASISTLETRDLVPCSWDFPKKDLVPGSYMMYFCEGLGKSAGPGYWLYPCEDEEKGRVPAEWFRKAGGTLRIFNACGSGWLEKNRCWGKTSSHHGHDHQAVVVCDMTPKPGLDLNTSAPCKGLNAFDRCEWSGLASPPESIHVYIEV